MSRPSNSRRSSRKSAIVRAPRSTSSPSSSSLPSPPSKVKAPLIAECYASLECKLVDGRLRDQYNVFIFEVVKAHAAPKPKYPKTIHYRGDGMFMVAGRSLNLWRYFRPGML